MGPKKSRIEVPTDSVPELGHTEADVQQRREEREARESEEEAQKQREKARREGARREKATHSPEGVAEKQTKVTQKQSLEESWEHHSHDTRRGT